MNGFSPAARFAAPLGGCFLLLLAFAQIGSAAPAPENPKSRASEAFRPDQLILKLSPDRAKSLNLGDGSALSALLVKHGAVSQRRAFAGPGSSQASIATAAQSTERARRRFPKRAARAPRVQETPDLENIFVVQLAGLHEHPASDRRVGRTTGSRLRRTQLSSITRWRSPLPDEPFIPNDRYVSEDGVHFSEGAWGQAGSRSLGGSKKFEPSKGWNEFDLDDSGDFDASETRPGEHVVVAVIDSGLDARPPRHRRATSGATPPKFRTTKSTTMETGFVDDVFGWDFVDATQSPKIAPATARTCRAPSPHTETIRSESSGSHRGRRSWRSRASPTTGAGDAVALANADPLRGRYGPTSSLRPGAGSRDSAALTSKPSATRTAWRLVGRGRGQTPTPTWRAFSPANLDEVLAVAATDPDDVRASLLELWNRDRCLGTRGGDSVTQCKCWSNADCRGKPRARRRRRLSPDRWHEHGVPPRIRRGGRLAEPGSRAVCR